MAITYGTSAATLLSELLVQRGVCDYRQAFELSQAFDHELSRCGWIDTLDGTMFSREQTAESDTSTGGQPWPEKLI